MIVGRGNLIVLLVKVQQNKEVQNKEVQNKEVQNKEVQNNKFKSVILIYFF